MVGENGGAFVNNRETPFLSLDCTRSLSSYFLTQFTFVAASLLLFSRTSTWKSLAHSSESLYDLAPLVAFYTNVHLPEDQ